jgi:pantothenate synthetase
MALFEINKLFFRNTDTLQYFSRKLHANMQLLVKKQDHMAYNPITKETTPVKFTVVSQESWDHMIGHELYGE